jgi:4-hydroxybenzoate polyprenyltransferase
MEALSTPAPVWPLAALKALRPKQWTKNGVLLAPLIFAKSAFETGLVLKAFVAVAAFSLLASGVYVINDWVDRDKDRLHRRSVVAPSPRATWGWVLPSSSSSPAGAPRRP